MDSSYIGLVCYPVTVERRVRFPLDPPFGLIDKRSSHIPFTDVSRVRISLRSPLWVDSQAATATDCKSVLCGVRRFESFSAHQLRRYPSGQGGKLQPCYSGVQLTPVAPKRVLSSIGRAVGLYPIATDN